MSKAPRARRRFVPTKASDPSALAAAVDMAGRAAKRVPRLAVRSARESCIVVSFATAFGLQAQRVSSVFYDALTLMRHIELRVLFEFSTTLDTE